MTDLPSLPAWAKTLQRRVRQRGIDFCILHGPGVRDLHPLGARRFGTITDCLAHVILNDRSAIVTLRRWACEPLFLQRSVTFCLLVETSATLSAALVSDARTFEIAVPVPDEQERYPYLAGRGRRPETFASVDARRVAILTSGL